MIFVGKFRRAPTGTPHGGLAIRRPVSSKDETRGGSHVPFQALDILGCCVGLGDVVCDSTEDRPKSTARHRPEPQHGSGAYCRPVGRCLIRIECRHRRCRAAADALRDALRSPLSGEPCRDARRPARRDGQSATPAARCSPESPEPSSATTPAALWCKAGWPPTAGCQTAWRRSR